MAEPAAQPGGEGSKKGKKGILLWVVLGVIVLIGAGVASYLFLGRSKHPGMAHKPVPPVHYTALNQFVSNLASEGSLHYIEVTVELKSRNPQVPAKVVHNRPEIRDAILNILAAQTLPDVALPAGRKALRRKILDAVNAILTDKTEPPVAETGSKAKVSAKGGTSSKSTPSVHHGPILGVYFTAFVVQ